MKSCFPGFRSRREALVYHSFVFMFRQRRQKQTTFRVPGNQGVFDLRRSDTQRLVVGRVARGERNPSLWCRTSNPIRDCRGSMAS